MECHAYSGAHAPRDGWLDGLIEGGRERGKDEHAACCRTGIPEQSGHVRWGVREADWKGERGAGRKRRNEISASSGNLPSAPQAPKILAGHHNSTNGGQYQSKADVRWGGAAKRLEGKAAGGTTADKRNQREQQWPPQRAAGAENSGRAPPNSRTAGNTRAKRTCGG